MNNQLREKRYDWIGGLLLIGVGIFSLVTQVIDFNLDSIGIFILPGLGAIFLLSGIVTRQSKFIIPGGILSGIGWGTVLVTRPFAISGEPNGGVFLLSFALGWAVITLLTAVFTARTHWWPLIPGGIMGLIGAGLLFGGIFE